MASRKAAKTKSPFTKGAEAALDEVGSGGKFLSVKEGDNIAFSPLIDLEDLLSARVHSFWDIVPAIHVVCMGDDCPACEVTDAEGKRNAPGMKSYLPVATAEGESKILPFGVSVLRQLKDIEAEVGSLKGKVLKIKRTGSGFKTKYTIIPLGKTAKIDAIEPLDPTQELGPLTVEGVTELLTKEGLIGGRSTSSSSFFEDEDEDDSPFGEDDVESDDDDKWDEADE